MYKARFNKYGILRTLLIVIGIIVIYCFINLYRSYYSIELNDLQIFSEKIVTPVKIVAIGDLHDFIFSESNDELIDMIEKQQPDIVLMVGDLLNKYSDDAEVVINLIKELNSVAPIYYALGNHELEWIDINDEDLQGLLELAGAFVLNREYCDVEINDQKIRIGGLYDYAFSLQNLDMTDISNEKVQVYNFLNEFQKTDAFKIMLSHRPDSFIFGDASKVWDIDLVASGHLHGGQVVLPFLGGVYGGDQGWFPEYVHGMYEKDDMNILITSGLSTNKKAVPRWNNPPEIMILELQPAQ